MPTKNAAFADYCCELLASAGRCEPKRMFGGFGISIDGLTIAIVTDLGSGDKLWLKADDETRSLYEAAGCERFTYAAKGVERSMNYYAAPADALESPQLMAPWARRALECALKARAPRPPSRPKTKAPASPARPRASRPSAPAAKARAPRRSPKG